MVITYLSESVIPTRVLQKILLMEEPCTWDVENLVNNEIDYLSTGARFLP